MDIRSLAYRTDLAVRRLAGSQVIDHGDHVVIRTPANPTFWWGNFVLIAEPIAAGGIVAARALFERAHPGASHLAIGVDGTDGAAGASAELAASGIEVDTLEVLAASAPLAAGRAGAGAEIRELAGEADWAALRSLRLDVARDERRVTPGHAEFLERSLVDQRRLAATSRSWSFGAFVDGRLRSSLAIVIADERVARYQAVETHPEHRRKGLAGALLRTAAARAQRAGARTLVIVADPDGPAIGLYRSLGFVARERQVQLFRAGVDG